MVKRRNLGRGNPTTSEIKIRMLSTEENRQFNDVPVSEISNLGERL